jgi:uncharacterized protein (UPF0128 family)
MMRVEVHPAADRELEAIARDINEQRTGYGGFLTAYERALAIAHHRRRIFWLQRRRPS